MPHIHTEPGQIDYCADAYIVYQSKVLLRFHEKYKIWLVPGGHVELNETPEEAAVREAKEEVGLDIELWVGSTPQYSSPHYRELIPPAFMNVHKINDDHRHFSLAYFGRASTDQIIEPEGEEKSGGCRWFTREELLAEKSVNDTTKLYALKALEVLGS